MSQYQDKNLNEGRTSQQIKREDNDVYCEDQALIENEALDEELLSNKELANVSGGVKEDSSHLLPQEISYRAVGTRTNPLEPDPTFPTLPPLEDAP